MYDNLLTATEVTRQFGKRALDILRLRGGADRTMPNPHSKRNSIQLFKRERAERAGAEAIAGLGVPIDPGCRRAYVLGLCGMSDPELSPQQQVYYRAGHKARLRG